MFHKVILNHQNIVISPQVQLNEEEFLQVGRINISAITPRCEIGETMRNSPWLVHPPEVPLDFAAPLGLTGIYSRFQLVVYLDSLILCRGDGATEEPFDTRASF